MWISRTASPEVGRALAAAAAEQGFTLDPAQQVAVERLARLGVELARAGRRAPAPRGVYLWGPVGRGKSWLLDGFVATVPAVGLRRVHFHDFFRRLHAAVHRHRLARSAVDVAVQELLAGCRLVCFDEFHVNDVGDGMLVIGLLRELAARRVTLVTTSNYPPEGLLPNPLYHHLFGPGVALIHAGMDVVPVAGPVDYRLLAAPEPLGRGFRGGAYLTPGTPGQLARVGLTPPRPGEERPLRVGGRAFPVLAARDGLLWWSFAALCEGLTSANDVLALLEDYSVWVLDGLPRVADCSPDARQRFINLVDVLADRDVTLVVLAHAPLAETVSGARQPADLSRTASRLALLHTIA